jgi:hypothetical protein
MNGERLRAQARLCEDLAQSEPAARDTFLFLAQQWLKLAQQAERNRKPAGASGGLNS